MDTPTQDTMPAPTDAFAPHEHTDGCCQNLRDDSEAIHGHYHDHNYDLATPSTPVEQTAQGPSYTPITDIPVSAEPLLSAALLGGAALLWMLFSVIKVALPARILLLAVYLLAIGITSYQLAPIVSIVAIATGLVLTLGLTLVQLMARK